MSYFHGESFKIAPLFHHEIFHIYHDQFIHESDEEPLYLSLWREGLAVHAAKSLNPDATAGQLVLMDLMETLPPVLDKVASHFLTVMDEGPDEWYAVCFSDGDHEFIPQRAGYYLGQLVAQEVSNNRTWPQIMNLKGETLRIAIKEALVTVGGSSKPIEGSE
jgi:hypothetical protein